MYNDWGSLARDTIEGNINSLNFPEFHLEPISHVSKSSDSSSLSRTAYNSVGSMGDGSRPTTPGSDADIDRARVDLMWVAEYERRGLQMATEHLGNEMRAAVGSAKSEETMRALKLFINVTDLFGQVYVQKDLTARHEAG